MRKLKEDLRGILSLPELTEVIGAYDVVGDVAIVIIPPSLVSREHEIGKALLAANPRLRTVARRDGIHSGEFRTIPLKVIAGEAATETEIREFGVRLCLDPAKVYFSVRSGNERRRIASLVGRNENVLVMFSGIAPFPLVIAKHSLASWITGIEKNPVAHEYGLLNVSLNRKLKNISLYRGDVRDVLLTLDQSFDRIVMPLPTRSEEYLSDALTFLKPDGVLHFYDMQTVTGFQDSVNKIESACDTAGRRIASATVVRCGHCSPKVYRVCVDALVL